MSNDWVYDCETYPRVFTIAFEHAELPLRVAYEISDQRNDTKQLLDFLFWLKGQGSRLIGYNNVGFDYPVIHTLIKMGRGDAPTLYAKAMAIIEAGDRDKFAHLVKPSDHYILQVDLMKIHHFDPFGAKATSLKVLEFNMRADNIQDLPFPVGSMLDRDQIAVLKKYNAHDVSMTKAFYDHSKDMLAFRAELTAKYGQDFTNANDTAIGKRYFVMELEKAGVQVYDYSPQKGRTPRQTKRPVIHLKDAILPWIKFESPEFQSILDWFKEQSITETKGVFKDVTATVGGIKYKFGTGGIHGSVSSAIVSADDEYAILDLDVTSYYPNLAIQNGFYPEHLGETFVHIYKTLFEKRKEYSKKSAESAMLKLALNGVYGDSNNQYSVFFDPLFTMRVTLNGQMQMCMLIERLLAIPGLMVLQANTDGITVRVKRTDIPALRNIADVWSVLTKLTLEEVEYSRMNIADVNSYLSVRADGGGR